ncbi:MAG: GNAT family protein [Firmicutes bacterium]|nr:GNAT family protein [Bacillota bacterium]
MLSGPTVRSTCLRQLHSEDIAILRRWDADPELAALAGKKFSEKISPEQWWHDLVHSRTRIDFAVVNRSQQLIGDISLENITWRTRQAELRVVLGDKSSWGRGYGTLAIREMLDYARHTLHLRCVYLRVIPENLRAIRVYEKVGFHKVGKLHPGSRHTRMAAMILMEWRPTA